MRGSQCKAAEGNFASCVYSSNLHSNGACGGRRKNGRLQKGRGRKQSMHTHNTGSFKKRVSEECFSGKFILSKRGKGIKDV